MSISTQSEKWGGYSSSGDVDADWLVAMGLFSKTHPAYVTQMAKRENPGLPVYARTQGERDLGPHGDVTGIGRSLITSLSVSSR